MSATEINIVQVGVPCGLINNEATKTSVLDNLRQRREDAEKPRGGTAPPSRNPER